MVCLGDAVHDMAPNLAQRACLAVEEALALRAELRLYVSVFVCVYSMCPVY